MGYADQTVAQLKEELTKRSLGTSGVKKDLVKRLEDDDASKGSTEAPVEATESETAPIADDSAKKDEEEELLEEVEPVKEEEKKVEEEEKPKSIKEFTPEERKAMAVEHLNKKINRAKKFGAEESEIEELKKSLDRVEKYGVELGTSIAREIGLTSRPLHDGKPKHGKFRKNRGGFKNRRRH